MFVYLWTRVRVLYLYSEAIAVVEHVSVFRVSFLVLWAALFFGSNEPLFQAPRTHQQLWWVQTWTAFLLPFCSATPTHSPSLAHQAAWCECLWTVRENEKNSIWAKQCGTLLLNVDNEKWISFSICAHRHSIWESSSLLCVRTNLHDVCCSTVSNCWKLWYFIRESVRLDLVKWAVSTLNWTKIYKWTSHTTELSQSVMNTHHINSASCWWFAERKIIRVIIQTLSCVGAKSE